MILFTIALISLPLAGFLIYTCYQGLKTGKLRHSDSKTTVDYSKNPVFFVFILCTFSFFILVLLAGFFQSLVRFLS